MLCRWPGHEQSLDVCGRGRGPRVRSEAESRGPPSSGQRQSQISGASGQRCGAGGGQLIVDHPSWPPCRRSARAPRERSALSLRRRWRSWSALRATADAAPWTARRLRRLGRSGRLPPRMTDKRVGSLGMTEDAGPRISGVLSCGSSSASLPLESPPIHHCCTPERVTSRSTLAVALASAVLGSSN
jgi:hypothetical protein